MRTLRYMKSYVQTVLSGSFFEEQTMKLNPIRSIASLFSLSAVALGLSETTTMRMFTISRYVSAYQKRLRSMMIGSFVALVASPVLAESYGAVKVECWGNCSSITVGQVCDNFAPNSLPIAVACDDTATPGSGSRVPCGSSRGSCTPWGSVVRSDPVSGYCADGTNNDAVISCRSP